MKNINNVIKEQGLLNFAIQKGMFINVDRIIHNSICNIIKSSIIVGYGHSSSIYFSCVLPKVVGKLDE